MPLCRDLSAENEFPLVVTALLRFDDKQVTIPVVEITVIGVGQFGCGVAWWRCRKTLGARCLGRMGAAEWASWIYKISNGSRI